MNVFRIVGSLIALLVLIYFMNVSSAEGVVDIPAVNVTFNHRALGSVHVSLTRERKFGAVQIGRYLQGIARFRSHKFPVAASELNGVLTVTFPGKITGSKKTRQRFYKAKFISNLPKYKAKFISNLPKYKAKFISNLPKYKAKVSSVPSSALPESACALGEHKNVSHLKIVPEISSNALESVRVLTIRAFTDPEWRFVHGALSDFEIASVLNVSEALYNAQLGIRFRLLSITNFVDSTPELDPGYILGSFRSHPDTKEEGNVKSLFTGKDMTGNTVGIAYIGSVCYSKEYAYNVTQYYGTLTANIFTHELGHSLGAWHDTNGPGTVMYPSVSFGSAAFSQYSVDQINSFLDAFGSCIQTEGMSPSLDGATLNVKKVGRSVLFVLNSVRGVGIGGQQIVYRIKGRRSSKMTTEAGEVKVRVKVKGRAKVEGYVKERPAIAISKRIRF